MTEPADPQAARSDVAVAPAPPPRRTARNIAVGALVVVSLLAVFLATQLDADPTPERDMRGTTPTITVEGVDGSPITSADLDGKVVFVNFWNTWCIPCQQEEPVLAEFHAAHADDPDFEMLAIVNDDTRGAVLDWIDENPDAGYTVAFDPGSDTSSAFGVTGQPESYFLTGEGEVVCVLKGPADRQDLETMLGAARSGVSCEAS